MAQLTEQHYRLLQLVEANKYDTDELAKRSGFSEEYVNDLLVKKPNTGETGELFAAELKKVDRLIEERISRKTNLVRERLIRTLTQWIDSVKGGTDVDTKTRHKMLVDAINAVNKSMPYQVNIEQYNWKEGMTPVEAVSEFKRIKGLAHQFALRRRVQEFASSGATEGVVPDGQANEASEDAQGSVLRAQSEAKKLSHEQGSGEGDIRGE